jgi:hypothetical protein
LKIQAISLCFPKIDASADDLLNSYLNFPQK